MRITLIISSLAAGGAERVLSTLANRWAESGAPITLITLEAHPSDFYPLAAEVRREALDLGRPSRGRLHGMAANLGRIPRLRRALAASRPDAIVSFIDRTNVLSLAAGSGFGVPIVVAERINPAVHHPGAPWGFLRRLLYPSAAALVMQTTDARRWAEARHLNANVVVIPNPVARPAEMARPGSSTTVVAMGRLVPQKGFDVLLNAFAQCGVRSGWSLIIAGEGPEREALERLAGALGIADQVCFAGIVRETGRLLSRAGIFALPSRFEGFPNALLEAMAHGVPVIASDCPSGPRDIVRPGVDGLLVAPDDSAALGSALSSLIRDPARRQSLGHEARSVSERFSVGRILSLWDALLTRVR